MLCVIAIAVGIGAWNYNRVECPYCGAYDTDLQERVLIPYTSGVDIRIDFYYCLVCDQHWIVKDEVESTAAAAEPSQEWVDRVDKFMTEYLHVYPSGGAQCRQTARALAKGEQTLR